MILYKVRLKRTGKLSVMEINTEYTGRLRAGKERAISKEARDAIFATTPDSERYLAPLFEDCGTIEVDDAPEVSIKEEAPVVEVVKEVNEDPIPEEVSEELPEEEAPAEEVRDFPAIIEFPEPKEEPGLEPKDEPKPKKKTTKKRGKSKRK